MLTKIAVAPLLILCIHFLQKRFGATVSGIVPGLPITSGPISFFLALEQGRDYASQASLASIYGMAGISVFCILYSLCLYRFKPVIAILTSLSGWIAYSLMGSILPMDMTTTVALSYCILLPVLIGVDKIKVIPDAPISNFRWALPLKIVLVTSLIVSLTYASAILPSKWVGLLATFPIILAVLGCLSHACGERFIAFCNMRGGIIGAFSSGAFFITVSALLQTDMNLYFIYLIASLISICIAFSVMKIKCGER